MQPNSQPQPSQPAPSGYPAPVPPAPQPSQPQQPPAQQPAQSSSADGKNLAMTTAGPAKRDQNTTQNTLLISEIRDGVVVMNDGSFRMVVGCQSINFDLMSSREREAIEYSYQNFLNSLYFPTQIFIRSQRVDIGPYLDRLDKIRRNQDNMLLGVLMDDYIGFITAVAEETNIMDKRFFIVVPYFSTGDVNTLVSQSKGFFSSLFGPKQQQHIKIDEETYNKARDELKNRASTVVNGLFQMGIKAVTLNTKQLGELYYNVYNPDTAVREPLVDFDQVAGATVIRKGQGEAPRPNLSGETI